MEYKENFVFDFYERTLRNLEIIELHKSKYGEGYEITQLINSLLGLLIIPQQVMFERIPYKKLSELERAGWPNMEIIGSFKNSKNLRSIVRHLRNAISHFHVEVVSESTEIKEIIFSDYSDRDMSDLTFCCKFDVFSLRSFTIKFVKLLMETE